MARRGRKSSNNLAPRDEAWSYGARRLLAGKLAAVCEAYLSNHADHLHYSTRLAQGRAIGSGQVEGACKNLIGRRLKQTGARWRFQRVNRMAGLCSVMYSKQWNAYWSTLAT